ncbi:hypothetical protein CALVIDRAFT_596268 [Calocera viscosa TUFC12733]|uniref:Aminoglycoside phosphotransferase domain-containing protein n=1 Tax=Calocera viscosa (strain TUFC12733) TaxID=1330018 RepID=A0A167PVL8_CALVF|nr:hypothetical protein CALVIDRAFT_596268 [Calocera viscosa TUFC12733]
MTSRTMILRTAIHAPAPYNRPPGVRFNVPPARLPDGVSDIIDVDGPTTKPVVTRCRMTDIKETDVAGVKKVDLDALQVDIEKWAGVECLHITKWDVGRHHIVYRCQLHKKGKNGLEHIIVRLCKPCLREKKLASETATIRYIRKRVLLIPIPPVFYVNLSPDNPVGCEFSFQRLATGVNAEIMWTIWQYEDKVKVVDNVADMMHALFTHRLTTEGYGALLPSSNKPETIAGWMAGPAITEEMLDRSFDAPKRGRRNEQAKPRLPVPCGPWESPSDWMGANIKNQLRYLEHTPEEACQSVGWDLKTLPKALDGHKRLLRQMVHLASVVPCPPSLPNSVSPALWRPSLKLADIMTLPESGEITALLDWELTVIVPLWQAAVVPSFLVGSSPADAEAMERYRTRFVDRMHELDTQMAELDPWTVKWHDCYTQGLLFRQIKEHCDKQWYELNEKTQKVVNQWAALARKA